MLFINKTTEQRGETVTSANPTETVPSIKHLQFRFQHASLYMHVPLDKKHLSTPKEKKKKRSHLTLCSAEGVWPSSCYYPQEPFAWSPAGAEMGEFTPMSTASLPWHPMQPFVSECTLGLLLGQLLYKKQLF